MNEGRREGGRERGRGQEGGRAERKERRRHTPSSQPRHSSQAQGGPSARGPGQCWAEAGRDRPATNSGAPQPKARAAAEGEGPVPPAPEVGTEPWEEARPWEGAPRSPPYPPHLSIPAAPRGPLLPDAGPVGTKFIASRPVIRLGCLFNFLPRMRRDGPGRAVGLPPIQARRPTHHARTPTRRCSPTPSGEHIWPTAAGPASGLGGGGAGTRQGGHSVAPAPMSPRPGRA